MPRLAACDWDFKLFFRLRKKIYSGLQSDFYAPVKKLWEAPGSADTYLFRNLILNISCTFASYHFHYLMNVTY